MWKALFGRKRREYDGYKPMRRGRDIGDVIAATLDGQWPGAFERVGDLTWSSGSVGHIRRIFQFQTMKGATLSAIWGVSCDFVPSASSKRLRWKRTAKTAHCDITIDPVDTAGFIHDRYSLFHNDDDAWIAKVAIASLKSAMLDWARLGTLPDLVSDFQTRSAKEAKRFGLDNYVQTELAWGLMLLALGERQQGEIRLASFCSRFGVLPNDPLLLKARDWAIRIAEVGA